jgi:hypothetical protein
MQRGTPANTHGHCGFLKLVLTGFVVFFIIIASLVLVATSGGPLLLLLSLAAATSLATAFLAGPFSTILGSLLVSPFVFSFLPLDKLFNLPAILEVMALGAMDLAILLVGALRLVGSRQGLTGGTPGNILAGAINLGLLGGAGVAGFLNNMHSLALTLPVTPSTFPCRDGGVFSFRVDPRAGILAGEPPSLFNPSTLIGQSIELGNIPDFGHRQLLPHLALRMF